jgi:methylated-DNA-protein-cysteine methyltransferase-like protein
MNVFDKVYAVVSKIPRGKVTTYGEIAKKININNPRIVGYALHSNKSPDEVPCHRVVNIKGEVAPGFAFGGSDVQRKLLESEGVKFFDGKVSSKFMIFNL